MGKELIITKIGKGSYITNRTIHLDNDDDRKKAIESGMLIEKKCKHYDREEINLVMDGKTPPVLRCKDCGIILESDSDDNDNQRV